MICRSSVATVPAHTPKAFVSAHPMRSRSRSLGYVAQPRRGRRETRPPASRRPPRTRTPHPAPAHDADTTCHTATTDTDTDDRQARSTRDPAGCADPGAITTATPGSARSPCLEPACARRPTPEDRSTGRTTLSRRSRLPDHRQPGCQDHQPLAKITVRTLRRIEAKPRRGPNRPLPTWPKNIVFAALPAAPISRRYALRIAASTLSSWPDALARGRHGWIVE
jgi:hypothetical protein